jgi:hypothetical protein
MKRSTYFIMLILCLGMKLPLVASHKARVLNPGERLTVIRRELAKGPEKANIAEIHKMRKGLPHTLLTRELRGDIHEAERVQKEMHSEEKREKHEEKQQKHLEEEQKHLEEKEEGKEIEGEVEENDEEALGAFNNMLSNMRISDLANATYAPLFIKNLNSTLEKTPFIQNNPNVLAHTTRGRMYHKFIEAFVSKTQVYVRNYLDEVDRILTADLPDLLKKQTKEVAFVSIKNIDLRVSYLKAWNRFFDLKGNLRTDRANGLLGNGGEPLHDNFNINKAENAHQVKNFIIERIIEVDPTANDKTTENAFVGLISSLENAARKKVEKMIPIDEDFTAKEFTEGFEDKN